MATVAHPISLPVPENLYHIPQAVESDPSVFRGSLKTQHIQHETSVDSVPGSEDGDLDPDIQNYNPMNVRMFSNAQNISMRDTSIHNFAGDMTIIHNHNTYHDSQPHPSNILFQWSNLFSSTKSHIFHAVEIIKGMFASGFVTTPEICLDENVAEDALNYTPVYSVH